jgi:hypothetical protein
MDKRYQIFVSSTYTDLREERAKVVRAIQEGGNIPTGMELWGAANQIPWNVIDAFLKACDYYVLIIKARYGSIDDSSGLSYTEREYDTAYELGIPVLAFVYDDPDGVAVREADTDPARKKRLQDFIDKVSARHTTKAWRNGDQLMYFVSNAIRNEIERTPRVGWVRGDVAVDSRVLIEQEELRKENARLKSSLETQRMLPPAGIDRLAGLDTNISLPYVATIIGGDDRSPLRGYSTPLTTTVESKRESTLGAFFDRLAMRLWRDMSNENLIECVHDETRSIFLSEYRSLHHDDVKLKSFSIDRLDIEQIVVQLYALGLLEEVTNPPERDLRWRLSPYGRKVFCQRVAIKRAGA